MSGRITFLPNPFTSEKREIPLDIHPSSGERRTIDEYISQLEVDREVYDLIVIDGDQVVQDYTKQPESDQLIVRAVPKGDLKKGGFLAFSIGVLTTILGIGVASVNPIAGAAIIAVGVDLMIGGIITYVVAGALSKAYADLATADTAPSIRGSKNRLRAGARLPILLGKHLIVPDVAALPYTEYSLDNQYLHQLFCAGYKEIDIDAGTIKIGENPIANYNDVNYEEQRAQTAVNTYYPNRCIDESISSKLTTTYIVRRTPTNTRTLRVLLSFTRGLGHYDDDGELENHSVTVQVEYSIADAGSWSAVGATAQLTYTDATAETVLEVEEKILDNLTGGGGDYSADRQYDVRVKLVTEPEDTSRYLEDCYWTILQSVTGVFDDAGSVDTRPVESDTQALLTMFGIKIKATDQLSGVIDSLSFVGELECREYSGSGSGTGQWTEAKTRNPAAMFLYVLQNEKINRKPVADAKIDWTSLEAWWSFCDTKGFECNAYLTGDHTIEQLLNYICSTGRASWNLLDNKYTIVIDTTRPTVSQYFTPRNSWGFQGSKAFADRPTTLKLQFVDADADYVPVERLISYNTSTEEVVYDEELEGLTQEAQLFGITDPEHAAKIGAYMLAATYLRPEIYAFYLDIEYLISTRGDRVQITHDVPMFGLAYGRIITVSESGGNTLGFISDEYVTFEHGTDYGVTIRKEDGIGVTLEVVNPSTGDPVATQTIEFDTPIAEIDVLHAEDLFLFGELESETRDLIITQITPGENANQARIICVDYSPDIFTADSGSIPAYDPGISKYSAMPENVVARVVDPERLLVDIARQSGAAEAAAEAAIADRPTYTEVLDGFDEEEGTTTPETPLGLSVEGDNRDMKIDWLPQTVANGYTATLTNLAYWEVQVSADQTNWYSLEFDGSDWKDTLDAVTKAYNPSLLHTNIPNAGTPPAETGRTLYYRTRSVPQTAGVPGTPSSWCTEVSGTTNPILAYNESIPPLNGAITNLVTTDRAGVTITFTVGDDTHSSLYSSGQYSGLAGHQIYRRLNAGGAEVQLVGDVNNATQTTHVDTTSKDGVAYDYGIAAYDVNGNVSTIAWYGTPITPQWTELPDDVPSIGAVALPGKIVISWEGVGGDAGPYTYTLERSADGGSTYPTTVVTDTAFLTYEEDIAEAEYSAISGGNGYWYRIKAKDAYGNVSSSYALTGADPTRDPTFGTWAPATVATAAVHASGSGRSIAISVDGMGYSTPSDRTDDLIQADGIAIQISINGTNWYEPNFENTGSTDANRWYTGSEDDYAELSGYEFSLRNLPLTNEAAGGPVSSETYYFRFKYRRHGTGGTTLSGSWSSSVSVVCTATSAKDVVENTFKQSQMDMSDWFLLDGTGLVGEWSLNDIGQSDAETLESKDNSGNENHATASNQLTVADGPAGPCPDLNGSSEYLTIPDASELQDIFDGGGSLVVWVAPDSDGSDSQGRILSKSSSDGWELYVYSESGSSVRVRFLTCFDGVIGIWHTTSYIPYGSFSQIAVSYDASSAANDPTIWIDGTEETVVETQTPSGTYISDAGTNLLIGRRSAAASYFEGDIAFVRLYNRELAQKEVRWLYENPAGNVPAMLLADRVAAGSILAESLTVLAKDHVNNPTKTGNLAGWGHHDEYGQLLSGQSTALTLETGLSYGGATVSGVRITDDYRWGVRLKSFPLDHSKIYKVQWTVKSSAAAALHYCGLVGETAPFEADEADNNPLAGSKSWLRYANSDRSSAGSSQTTNMYLVSEADVSADWTTYTSYIVGYDRAITDVPEVTASFYAKAEDPDLKHCSLRFLLWSAVASSTHDIINVTVQEVGSGTIVAENISTVNLSAINANLGDITAGNLDFNAYNYWHSDSLPSLTEFRVGDASNYILWDGADLNIDVNEMTIVGALVVDGPSVSILSDVAADSWDSLIVESENAAGSARMTLETISATGHAYIRYANDTGGAAQWWSAGLDGDDDNFVIANYASIDGGNVVLELAQNLAEIKVETVISANGNTVTLADITYAALVAGDETTLARIYQNTGTTDRPYMLELDHVGDAEVGLVLSNTGTKHWAFVSDGVNPNHTLAIRDVPWGYEPLQIAAATDDGMLQLNSYGVGILRSPASYALEVNGDIWLSGSLRVPAYTFVEAKRTTAQSIPHGTWTTFIFSTENYDAQTEYNTSTGEFTATNAGLYHISATVLFGAYAWSAQEGVIAGVFINGNQEQTGNYNVLPASNTSLYMSATVNTTVRLAAGDVLTIRVFQIDMLSAAKNTNTNGDFTHLSIVRVPGYV